MLAPTRFAGTRISKGQQKLKLFFIPRCNEVADPDILHQNIMHETLKNYQVSTGAISEAQGIQVSMTLILSTYTLII
uniref:Uncharacterized protein n=1 Tax=Rhizophora mucronata TaxID=61149 RepID=A0A2P2NKI9_RHIMU